MAIAQNQDHNGIIGFEWVNYRWVRVYKLELDKKMPGGGGGQEEEGEEGEGGWTGNHLNWH